VKMGLLPHHVSKKAYKVKITRYVFILFVSFRRLNTELALKWEGR